MANMTDNLIIVRGNPDNITAWMRKACRPIEGCHQPSIRKCADFFLWRLFHNFVPVSDEALAQARDQGEIDFEAKGWGVIRGADAGNPCLDRPTEKVAHLRFSTYYAAINGWVEKVARDHPELEFDHYFCDPACTGLEGRSYHRGRKKRDYDYTNTLVPAGKCEIAFRLDLHRDACEAVWKRVKRNPRQWMYRLERARFCLAMAAEMKKEDYYDYEPEPIGRTNILFPPSDCLGQARLDLDAAGQLGATSAAEYWLLRADLAEAVEEPDTRLKCLTTAIETEGSCPMAYCRRAEHHLAAGKQAVALGDLNVVIERFPTFPKAFFLRSQLSLRSLEQQLADLDRYLELNPADWGALFLRGFKRAKTERHAEACRDLEECRCIRGIHGSYLDCEEHYVVRYVQSLAQCGRSLESEIYAIEVLDGVTTKGELCPNHWKSPTELVAIALNMHLVLFTHYFKQKAYGTAEKHLGELRRLMNQHSDVAPKYFGEIIPALETVLKPHRTSRPSEERSEAEQKQAEAE